MRQDTGRVGIGTRNPGYKLEVRGNGLFADGLRVYGTTDNASGYNSVFHVGKSNNVNYDFGIKIDHGTLDYGLDINSAGIWALLFRQHGGYMARFSSAGNLERYLSNSGYLIGCYDWPGGDSFNSQYANPIYTIGRYHCPKDKFNLGNMYGVGYSHMGNAGFLNDLRGDVRDAYTGWGFYVAADGDARIFLNGSNGQICTSGEITARYNFKTKGWFESYANAGWYNYLHGGGWMMEGGAWIESYGSPGVWIRGSAQTSTFINGAWVRELYPFLDTVYWRGGSGVGGIGLRVQHGIHSGRIYVNSDERIKKNIEPVPDDLSLQKLRAIECYYYDYKDESKNTDKKVIGFIAQQVNKYFPNAVTLQKLIIPNIYKPIIKYKLSVCDENGNELDPSVIGDVDKTVDLPGKQLLYSDICGNRDENGYFFKCKCNIDDCKSYDNNPSHFFKLTILDNYNFDVNKKYQFNCSTVYKEKFIEKIEQVSPMKNDRRSFIIGSFAVTILYYGEEVDDFHTIDKQRIFALNFSATQEIDKIQRAEIEKVKQLESTVLTQKNTIDNLQSELSSLKTLLREKNII